jgi:anaerobic selenocysteine-containing dehydrogenase
VVCDAFQSEMTAFADLILPDTTYLERHDCMSMLDRPISEFDGPVDSVRIPVLPPTGQCKPFQEVLVELASRLKLPAFTTAEGGRKFRDYPDFIVNYETAPGSGIGFLAGWRGKGGEKSMRGEPNPKQWEMYEKNNCVFQHHLAPEHQYMRNWNDGYMRWAQVPACGATATPSSSTSTANSCSASAWRRRARPRANSRRTGCASGCRPTSTRCPSTTRRWKSRPPTPRATRSTR